MHIYGDICINIYVHINEGVNELIYFKYKRNLKIQLLGFDIISILVEENILTVIHRSQNPHFSYIIWTFSTWNQKEDPRGVFPKIRRRTQITINLPIVNENTQR